MTWSLLNMAIAPKVEELVAAHDDEYPPEVKRGFSRDQALSIIHAALWAYSSRDDSTAFCYAFTNLMNAMGLKEWAYEQDEADALQRYRNQKWLRESTPPSPLASGGVIKIEGDL